MPESSEASQIDTPVVGVHIGDVDGGIRDSTIAGRDVVYRTTHVYGSGSSVGSLQNRRAMLKQVKNFWIKGVLLQAQKEMGLLELGLTTRPDAVSDPLRATLPGADYPERPLPAGTKIIDVLDEVSGWLLILGEPGAGKTIMLLELASDAIRRAESDPSEPIPAIFNLSSWGTKQQAFDEWLIDELNSKYTIPRIVARQWIDTNQLLLLLDGLDEVRTEKRDACVQAINRFRSKYGLPFVVCSRVADYDLLPTKIMATAAVVIHPLSDSQIAEYLTSSGSRFETLRAALVRDPAMMELAHSPLMLKIMATTYQDLDEPDRGQSDSVEVRRTQMLNAYVQSMFKRRGRDSRDLQARTIERLAWLARLMSQHSESLFIVERLQPTWLRTERHRHQYAVLSRILAGCVTGGFIGLILACLTFVVFWPFPLAAGGLVTLFGTIVVAMFIGAFVTAVGGLIGLVVGLVHSRTAATERIDVVENLAWSWRELSIELRRRWRIALQGFPCQEVCQMHQCGPGARQLT